MDVGSVSRQSFLRRTTCVKCSKNGDAVLNGKDVYCKFCFDDYCVHKFRSSFGKHKIFQKLNERVLVAVSGGPISAGILRDLICRSIDSKAPKKLQIQPEFLHIVETSTIKFGENVSWLGSMKEIDIPVHVVHLASIFDHDSTFRIKSMDEKSDFEIDQSIDSQLIELLGSFRNDTSRFDFYRRLKTLLLVRCARKLGIRYLIVGETCTALSNRLLSNTTQGRGGQTKDDVGILDLRWSISAKGDADEVRIVRPLREFQNKEIAYYNYFRRLYDQLEFCYERPTFLPNWYAVSSLQSISIDFVEELQAGFPATVSTLFASASKLLATAPNASKIDSKCCRLCGSVIILEEEGDLPEFCYGCNLTLSDLDDNSLLPALLS